MLNKITSLQEELMKIKALALSAILASMLYGTAAYANVEFQAGNIDDGQKWTLQALGDTASYYKEGKSGNVKFTCELEPTDASDNSMLAAWLHSGKNFGILHQVLLKKGMNGSYTWTLEDRGETTGNIKVSLIKGDKNKQATIQCKTIS
jgi:opacity protein-like surface antigen